MDTINGCYHLKFTFCILCKMCARITKEMIKIQNDNTSLFALDFVIWNDKRIRISHVEKHCVPPFYRTQTFEFGWSCCCYCCCCYCSIFLLLLLLVIALILLRRNWTFLLRHPPPNSQEWIHFSSGKTKSYHISKIHSYTIRTHIFKLDGIHVFSTLSLGSLRIVHTHTDTHIT